MPDRYIFRAGCWRDPNTNEPMPLPTGDEPRVPRYVISDIAEYRSPIDGTVIGGRRQKRYDLERNGCVEAPPRKPFKGYSNPHFAAKRGLPLSDEARERK